MRLYHVTLKKNRGSIGTLGVSPLFSRGARQECWFVTRGNLAWAFLHVMQRHRVHLDDVIGIEVLIPASKVTRRRRGVYTCFEAIRPLFIVEQVDGDYVAKSYPVTPGEDMMTGG